MPRGVRAEVPQRQDEPLFVLDKNAPPGQTRRHEIVTQVGPGGEAIAVKGYDLPRDVGADSPIPGIPMPEAHALQFLRDSSFIVMRKNGTRIPPAMIAKEGGTGGFELPEDETIAKWDELSNEALFRRCKAYADSLDIAESTAKSKKIAFLKGKIKRTAGVSRGSENVVGQMPEAELDRFPEMVSGTGADVLDTIDA